MTEFAAPLPILARYAVMVDVGYIYAAAGELLFGSSSRRDFRVDAVIRPAETRLAVTRALRALRTKRQTLPPKKHGNIPL